MDSVSAKVYARWWNVMSWEAAVNELDLLERDNIVPKCILADPAFKALGLAEPCARQHVVLPDGWRWLPRDGGGVRLCDADGTEVYSRRRLSYSNRFD